MVGFEKAAGSGAGQPPFACLEGGVVTTKRVRSRRLLSERLLEALTSEVDALEAQSDEGAEPMSGKARIDAIGQLTRTLEKLLELKQLETVNRKQASEGDDAETQRLRGELLRRLKALDARRQEAGRLIEGTPC